MDLNYKKSLLIESMGYNIVLPTFYGKKAHNIKLTESQFKRLVESYIEDEDLTLAEMNFGDEDGDNLPSDVNFHDDNFDPALNDSINEDDSEEEMYETSRDKKGEYRGAPSQVEKRDTYDGRPGKVIGVYDDNLDKKSREGEVYEDRDLAESIDSHLKNLKKYMNNK